MTEDIRAVLTCAGESRCWGKLEAARESYRRAARLSAEANLPELQAEAVWALAGLDRSDGRWAEALEGVELVIDLWEQAGEPRRRAFALQERAEILTRLERRLDARLAWRAARAALVVLGDANYVSRCDQAIHDLSDQIQNEARAERRATATPALSRSRLFGRRWVR